MLTIRPKASEQAAPTAPTARVGLSADPEAPAGVRTRHRVVTGTRPVRLRIGQVLLRPNRASMRCPSCGRLTVFVGEVVVNGDRPTCGPVRCGCPLCRFTWHLADGAVRYREEDASWTR